MDLNSINLNTDFIKLEMVLRISWPKILWSYIKLTIRM